MSKKIGLVGYLGYSVENPIIGGQMAKTRGIFSELKRKYGEENIIAVDTANWRNEKFSLFSNMLKIAKSCDLIVVMPNKNGIKIVLPLFSTLKGTYKYKLVYPVVGGWLTGLLKKHSYLAKAIRKIDYILPETSALAEELKEFVDCRIDTMAIFSTREPVSEAAIKSDYGAVKRYCTFSRVTPEKGIDDAIEAVVKANKNGMICSLDVWGPIEEGFKEHYDELFKKHSDCVTYKGVLAGDEGLSVLSEYYMMVFPTYYPGEGFPTSVCESFMAALPVIASDWRFNGELVENGKTGYLFPVHNVDALTERLVYSSSHPDEVIGMKKTSLSYSDNFVPENVTRQMFDWIDNERKGS